MKKNFYEILSERLMECDRYVSESGKLLKANVYSDAMTMNKELLEILLDNEEIRNKFFVLVNGSYVFDKQGFAWFIESKEFLPDSYTIFENKIGLNSNRKFLMQSNDIVINFPYKDCVLEGGQTKEEQKRDEIFYNEIIASDEITRMLSPKVFTNAKRYTKDGIKENIELNNDDNLVIKGNNLIALSSLLKRYEGKIKCIYIDPPYNTGSDSFGYNDNFNHSTWLVFMKNRLELAKKFLKDEGVIFTHCDDNEQAYLKVLMDEIFGREQYIETITVVNNPRGRDYGGIANMHEFIHVYAKNNQKCELYRLEDPDKVFPFKDQLGGYETRELRNRNTAFHIGNRPNLCYPFYINPNKEVDNGFLELSLEPKEGYIEVMPAKSMGVQTVWRWGKEKAKENLNINVVGKRMNEAGRFMIVEKYRDNKQMARSVWWDKEVNSERGTIHLRELFNGKVFNFPKPEELIRRILNIATVKGDLVMDFHVGSGTTATTAHKMNRKYICIEQMDYINEVTVPRLQKVIEGENGGISKVENWNGGGSFVYCELKENGQDLVNNIINSNEENINSIKEEIYNDDRIISYITREDLKNSKEEFEILSLEEKRQALISIIDKNKLYVNYSDIEDENYNISEEEKKFTKSFYGETN